MEQETTREWQLAEAFVGLADTLTADYDVVDLLHRLASESVRFCDVGASGLVLDDQRGSLRVMAASTEQSRLLELVQIQNDEGPCLECSITGEQILAPDLAVESKRWPRFSAEAVRQGFRAVHALPMRLRGETIGALNLFSVQPGALPETALRVGQALADVATIGILHQRAVHRSEILSEQLQTALNSRIIIEQAKGILAEHGRVSTEHAFTRLRRYARDHNRRLSDVAHDVVNGALRVSPVLACDRTP